MEPYDILLDGDSKSVRVTARGEITRAIGEEIITKARKLAVEQGYSILYDVREATLRVDLSRYFFMPRELEVLTKMPTRQVRVAILVPERQLDEYRFYQTAAGNVGLSVNIFLNENDATEWLRTGAA